MTLSEADPRWKTANEIWARFGELTRFVSSTEIALAREAALWRATDLVKADSVKIRQFRSDGIGEYRVAIEDHITAVSNLDTLHGLVLLGYCSLAEDISRLALASERVHGGIEQWGTAALETNAQSFDDVKGGLPGMVTIYAVRNAVAHGSSTWTEGMRERVRKAGGDAPPLGAAIEPETMLNEGRPRLRSFMKSTGMSVV